jgi:hypothetical protein
MLPSPPPDVAHSERVEFELTFLPGFTLKHTLRLVSEANLNVVGRTADILKDEGASVLRWEVIRTGNVMEQKIVFGSATEAQVFAWRSRLLGLEDVLRARLEHFFVRVKQAN